MATADIIDLRIEISRLVATAAQAAGAPTAPESIVLDRPKQAQHGDFACNVAMQLARALKRNPRELAQRIAAELPSSPLVDRVEIAGAGFINFFLKPIAKQRTVTAVLQAKERYGRSGLGAGRRTQVEFVSANPTGPLHVGHGRGAAFGASLANLLDAAGYAVQREYYVNDAGRQMDILAVSTWMRYLELFGSQVPFPRNAYQGDYVRDMARQIEAAHARRYVHDLGPAHAAAPAAESEPEAHLDALIAAAKRLLGDDYAYVHQHVLTEQIGDCRNDLMEFGVHYDCWFSERSLFDGGQVGQAIDRLRAAGHLYEQDGAMWFRSSAFGDEKDRVVQRENGEYTYFASDIAYHANKFGRGYDLIVDIWGADHHGYVPRVKAAMTAMGLDAARIHVPLVQFAVLYRDGKKASMSTRSGEFVTLRELRGEVGNDAARFFYVMRKSDQHLDFDLDLAKSRSNENPVYYIQYAHARICSVLDKWGGTADDLTDADVTLLDRPHELELLQALGEYPETIESAAREFAPHAIAYYLKELAGKLHSYYNAEQVLVEHAALKDARLALLLATRQVLRNGLALLGVSAPDKM